jgi:hypothetical protein
VNLPAKLGRALAAVVNTQVAIRTPIASFNAAGYRVVWSIFILVLLFSESMRFVIGRLKAASRLH